MQKNFLLLGQVFQFLHCRPSRASLFSTIVALALTAAATMNVGPANAAPSAGCTATNGGALNIAATHNAGNYNTTPGFAVGDVITFTTTRTGHQTGSGLSVNGNIVNFADDQSSNGATFSTNFSVTSSTGTTLTEMVSFSGMSQSNDTLAVTATCTPAGAPTITGFTPTSGPTNGVIVDITGTNFQIPGTPATQVTSVTFGGVAAQFIVADDNHLRATPRNSTAGAVTIAVTNANGTGTSTSLFTFVAPASAPTVTSVSPNTGSPSGGTSIVITGTNFTGVSAVTIGGVAATSFVASSSTSLLVVTPAHSAGTVDVVVTTPGGTATGTGLFTYATPATSTGLASSLNPSRPGIAVTFTASVTSSGGTPTGAVLFSDGGIALGTVTLSNGVATLTTSALAVGSHAITATYSGNFGGSSASLTQVVNTNQDSQQLRALQIVGTKVAAQNSGAAISGAIDSAIAEGFDGGGQMFAPSAGGMRLNFAADPGQQPLAGNDGNVRDAAASSKSRMDDAFASVDRNAMATKAPPLYTPAKEWLLWSEVRGTGIDRWTASAAGPAVLYGDQVNALLGLTRRFGPNILLGVVGGYENFRYQSDTLAGRLRGEGWTAGGYLGWRFAPGLRFDAAAAYSGIDYNGVAGLAAGNFSGRRWLASGGVTGTYKAAVFEIEPSARVYALWENENAYVDSLGAVQASRDFFTGRGSAGVKVAYPWLLSGMVTVAPYAGLYADYYFNRDNAAPVVLAGAPVVVGALLDGWSARATGGVAARFGNGTSVAVGGELGGIGGTYQIWSVKGRASVPF